MTIETADELAVAEAAIEEYRKTKIRHVGIYANRMRVQCEQSIREAAFAEAWELENSRTYSTNILASLLCTESGKNTIVRDLTPIEATAVATVIQWLGTNVGWCFLCQCIKKAGYSEPRK